jgi:multidrug efflux pump subunit AcrA (membrane-fusion protein)
VALDEARARYREAEIAARAAAEQADIFVRLDARRLVSRLEFLRTKADADQKRAAADALLLAISRLDRDQRTKDSDRTARITQFSREVTQLDGDIRTAEATLARLAHTIDQTRVRAPITGYLGEVATLQPGAVVRQGDTLGVVLPPGALQVVASFLPAIAPGPCTARATSAAAAGRLPMGAIRQPGWDRHQCGHRSSRWSDSGGVASGAHDADGNSAPTRPARHGGGRGGTDQPADPGAPCSG